MFVYLSIYEIIRFTIQSTFDNYDYNQHTLLAGLNELGAYVCTFIGQSATVYGCIHATRILSIEGRNTAISWSSLMLVSGQPKKLQTYVHVINLCKSWSPTRPAMFIQKKKKTRPAMTWTVCHSLWKHFYGRNFRNSKCIQASWYNP